MAGAKSRWKNGNGVPRHSVSEEQAIVKKYHEPKGWHRGAKVSPHQKQEPKSRSKYGRKGGKKS